MSIDHRESRENNGPWNMDSILSNVAERLNEAVRIEHTRNLLTWTACLTVGQAFSEIPQHLHGQALKELVSRTRRSTRTLTNYMRVYEAIQGMELPQEAMEVLQYSVVLAVLTEYGDERGRELILRIHDDDLSLMQARVQATTEEIKQAKAGRKRPSLMDALKQALAHLGKRTPTELNEVEREQVRRIVSEILSTSAGHEPQ